MGGRAPVTRVVLQFPGWRVTMNNLHRHKNHQQDAQHDCDRLAELGTRSFHLLFMLSSSYYPCKAAWPQPLPDLGLAEALGIE
jgi:hypothetical protein